MGEGSSVPRRKTRLMAAGQDRGEQQNTAEFFIKPRGFAIIA